MDRPPQDRHDPGDDSPPPPRRSKILTDQVWPVVRGGLSVAAFTTGAGHHEALTWTVRAIAVLGDIAVTVWKLRRR